MDLEALFMVRDASFGANFTPKLFVAVLTMGLVAWDVAVRRRWDYLWVFITGSVVWTLVELSLQVRGTRVMPERLLFGSEIPLAVSLPLQGIAEGAFVAVVGIFVADRVLDPATRARALVGFAFGLGVLWLLIAIQAARVPVIATTADAASRRDMIEFGPLLFLLAVVAFDVWFWLRRPRFRRRTVAMAAAMVAFSTVWTIAEVTTGGRWVEVAEAGAFVPAPATAALAAFAFDVVVEIALAYVPFLAVPMLLGLIRAGTESRGISEGSEESRVTGGHGGGSGHTG